MDVALNWLWQGGLVALATALLVHAIGPMRPQARYRVLWVALASVCLLPLVALALAWRTDDPGAPAALPASAALVSLPAYWWTSDAAALGAWGLWAAIAFFRSFRSITALRRASRSVRLLPVVDETRLHHWSTVRSARRLARLGLCDAVPSAAVLVGQPPVIAISPMLLRELDDEDLDRVVIHEWAHVQRRDDLAVLLELLMRVAVGWHPAFWWLDRQIRAEREAACDELAVEVTGSAKGYAKCLATLASLRTPQLRPLAAVGALAPSGLRDRVVRVLTPRRAVSRWRRTALGAASGMPCALALAIGGVPIIDVATVVAEVQRLEDHTLAETMTAIQSIGIAAASAEPASEQRRTPPATPAVRAEIAGQQPETMNRSTQRAAPGPAPDAMPAAPDSGIPLPVVVSSPTFPLDSSQGPLTATPMRPPEPSSSPHPNDPATLWGAAAEGGTAIGRGSQKAAVATAGFFTRMSKRLAGSF